MKPERRVTARPNLHHQNRRLTDPTARQQEAALAAQKAVAMADLEAAGVTQSDLASWIVAGGDLPEGWVESGQGTSAWVRDQISAVPDLRAAGLRDEVLEQILTDQPVSKIEYDAVAQLHKQRMADPAWCAKLLANDHAVVRESLLMSAVLAAEVGE